MKKIIIFGAGKNGIELLEHIGRDNVAFFCDNNSAIAETQIQGIPVISSDKIIDYYPQYDIYISVTDLHAVSFIRRQLEGMGIDDYILYAGIRKQQESILDETIVGKDIVDKRIEYYVTESEIIDPCENFQAFRRLVSEAKNDSVFNGWIQAVGRNLETLTYGHFDALRTYAGLDDMKPEIFPEVAHGGFFFDNFTESRIASIYTSPYFKKMHNERFPYIPIYTVGPYINYVRDDDKKEKCDDAALVFINHTVEFSHLSYDKDILLKEVLDKLRKRYSRIIVCVYWNDIIDDIYLKMDAEDIKIVCAGFRFDKRFIVRLKRIFDLCQDVYIYGRTSALIYALALNKRIFYNNALTCELIDNQMVKSEYVLKEQLVADAMYDIEEILSHHYGESFDQYDDNEKQRMSNYFGLDVKLSPEEIRIIYDISKDIWANCNYYENNYPMGVYKTYWEYQMKEEFEKLGVLSKALGKGFWNL